MSDSVRSLADVIAETAPAELIADGFFTVVGAIADGAKRVDGLTRRAALAGVLGDTGELNVQGEIVQVLDAAGTDAFVSSLRDCGRGRGAGLRGAGRGGFRLGRRPTIPIS